MRKDASHCLSLKSSSICHQPRLTSPPASHTCPRLSTGSMAPLQLDALNVILTEPAKDVKTKILTVLRSVFEKYEMAKTVENTEGDRFQASFIDNIGRFLVLRILSQELVTFYLHSRKDDDGMQVDEFFSELEGNLKSQLKNRIKSVKRFPALQRGELLDSCGPRDLLPEDDPLFIHWMMGKWEDRLSFYEGKKGLILGDVVGTFRSKVVECDALEPTVAPHSQCRFDSSQEQAKKAGGDVFTNLQGDIKVLEQTYTMVLKMFAEEGMTFDYIINNAMEIPASADPNKEEKWRILKLILDLSLSVLKKGNGRYIIKGSSEEMTEELDEFEEHLKSVVKSPEDLSRDDRFIQPLSKQWVFYSMEWN
ncbi:hypothetical protein AGOR_G00162870 [Albula goreensis]|uniref:Spermine synthase N-terminal domain-containing protein n=1 Tax=Albula goreensis TaxID=1534307 RepID=A0A8T3D486_9TELE|nr:hypothetical protein AGOR_G00162870 [Albula goreensis]